MFMFEMCGIDELDQAGVLAALASNRVARLEAEARELVLAVAWADLHNPDADLAGRGLEGVVLPGTEGVVRHGAHGTPPVLEFAAAEFASVNGMHPAAGENLIGDGLDLRHRHPGSWATPPDRAREGRKHEKAPGHRPGAFLHELVGSVAPAQDRQDPQDLDVDPDDRHGQAEGRTP
ncbi:MAG TPA: hypothetical protein VFG63_02355 [Nocardioidaceae bacterium]|nr:hypothetical protein [Nocardioidaceae bacterium]